MRVAFFGTPQIAVPSLEAIIAAGDLDLVAAVTNPDRPRGRSGTPRPPPVKVALEGLEVPVLQPTKPKEIVAELDDLDLDVAAVVAYGRILPRRVLDTATYGFVNLHFSLLPRWRGAAPVQHAIRAGDTTSGVTTFVLDEGMDTGPVLERVPVDIGKDETAGELLDRLAFQGAPVLVDSLRALVEGRVEPTPQSDEGMTLAPKIEPDDVRIDWSADGQRIVDLVRSASPAPGAHTTFRGDRLKVFRARQVDAVEGPPGRIATVDGGPVVACGAGGVVLEEVQPAGKARMSGSDFANGYQPTGETLGEDAA